MAERTTRGADETAAREKTGAAVNTDAALEESKAQVQEKMDEEQERGFRGFNPDPTPNEHYTFEGAAKGLPTPETDPHLAAATGRAVLTHAGTFVSHPLRKNVEKGKE